MAILTRTAGQTLSLSEVRAFFNGKFDPAVAGVDGSSLSHYLRDGGIVPATSQGGGGVTYPATGGIALDDLGSVQKTSASSTSWPADDVTLMGETSGATWDDDLDYVPGTTTQVGSINNDTGQTFTIFNITCAVNYTNLRGNASISPFFWVRRSGANIGFPNPTITSTGQQIYTISSNTGFTWNVANGALLDFNIFQGSISFDYTIDYLRINLTSNEEFEPTGTGGGMAINVDVPETSPLSLSQLRNVDDGLPEEQQQQQQGPSARSNPPPGGSTDDTDLSPTTGPNGE